MTSCHYRLAIFVVFAIANRTLAFTASLKCFGHVSLAPPLEMGSEGGILDDAHFQSGRVKFFDRDKGYGFIVPDGSSGARKYNVYAHQSKIHMDGFRFLDKDQRVHFRIAKQDDGRTFASDIYLVGYKEELDLDLAQVRANLEEDIKDATFAEAGAVTTDPASYEVLLENALEGIVAPEEIAEQLKKEKETSRKISANLDPFAAIKEMFKF